MAQVTSDEIAAAVAGHTVATRFRDMVAARPGQVALRWRTEGGWATWTWAEYADRACRLAGALRELGVARGERVVLMLRNRPEFHVADLAAVLCGATPVSIYNSSAPEQVRFLARHCGAVAGVVDGPDYLERMLAVRDELPLLQHLAVVDGGPAPDGVVPFDELCRADPVDLDEAAATAAPDDLATIIYTSGTTGPPKGVMLDHANVVWTVESLRRCLEPFDPSGWRLVSYLPMAHVAERMNSHYQAVTFGYQVTTCPGAGPGGRVPARDEAPAALRGPAGLGEDARRGARGGRSRPAAVRRARRGVGGRRPGAGVPSPGCGAPRRAGRRVRARSARRWPSCGSCSGSTRSCRRSAARRR